MSDVPRGTHERLVAFVALVLAENEHQNLIAPSTTGDVWQRHVEDSLQLLPLAGPASPWIDIGSGAGFPGLAVAIVDPRPMILVEPRRRRADFLTHVAEALGCTNVTVVQSKIENVRAPNAGVISARAVASLPALFSGAAHLADTSTVWLLPKGRGAAEELAEARRSWQGAFDIVPSRTDPESGIVVARDVKPKGHR